jgi:hypothetical protein
MVPGTSAPKKWEPNSKDPVLPVLHNEGLTSTEKQKPSKWKTNPQENVEKKTFIPSGGGLAPAASSSKPLPASTIATASNADQKASAQAKAPHSWQHPGLIKKSTTSVGDDTTSSKLGELSSEDEPTKKLTAQTGHGVGFKRGTALISPPSTGAMVPVTSSDQPSFYSKSIGGVDGKLSSVQAKTPYSGVQPIDGNDPKSSKSKQTEGRLSKTFHSGVPDRGPTGSDDNKNNMLLSSRHPTNSSPQGVPKIASKMTTSPWSKAAAVAAGPIITNDKSLVTEAGTHNLTLSLGATNETSSDPNVMLIAKSSSVDQFNSPTVLKKWTPNGPRVIVGTTRDETTPVVGSTQRGEGATMDTVSATTKTMNPVTIVGSKKWAGGVTQDTVAGKTKAFGPAFAAVRSKQLAAAEATQDNLLGERQAIAPEAIVVEPKHWAAVGPSKSIVSEKNKGMVPSSTVVGSKQWVTEGPTKPIVSEKTKVAVPPPNIAGSKPWVPASSTRDAISGMTAGTVPSLTVAGSKPWANVGATKEVLSGTTNAAVPSSTVAGSKQWTLAGAIRDGISGTTKANAPSTSGGHAIAPESGVVGSKQWAPAGAAKDTISGTTTATVPSSADIGSKPWGTTGAAKDVTKDSISGTTKTTVPPSTVIGSKPWATTGATKDTTKDAMSGTTKTTVPSSTVIGSKSWATTGVTKESIKDAIPGTTKAPVASSTVIGSKPWATTGATKNAISVTTTPIVPPSTVVASKPWSTTGTTKDSTKDDISETTKTAVPSSIGSKQWFKRGPSEDVLAETSKQAVPSSNTVIPPDQNPEEESFAFSNLRSKFRGRVG